MQRRIVVSVAGGLIAVACGLLGLAAIGAGLSAAGPAAPPAVDCKGCD